MRLNVLCCLLAAGWLGILPAMSQDTNAANLLWRLELPGKQAQSSPAIAPDGTIYLGTFHGWLLAVTPTGKIKWQFKTKLEIHSSPAVGADGTIYVGSRDRNIYAISPDGNLKWKFATGAWVDSSPAIAEDGTIYCGSHDRNLYALTPEGKLKWRFDAGGIVFSSPAIAADGTIYVGSHDRNFYAVSPDGKLKWKFPTRGPIDSSPTLAADGGIFFSSTDGNFYALDASGAERWRVHTSGYTGSTAVLDERGNLYVSADKDHVIITPEGKIAFQHPTDVPMDGSPAITANGQAIFSIPWLAVGTFHRDQPWPPRWTYKMDSNMCGSPNVNPAGVIYACSGWYLFALQPPSPAPPIKSAWPLWRGNPQQTGRLMK